MQSDIISLLASGAAALNERGDPGRAFALYEAANNLRLLMRGEGGGLAAWNRIYVGADRAPLDIDALLPIPGSSPNPERTEA